MKNAKHPQMRDVFLMGRLRDVFGILNWEEIGEV